jgi:uncharacterized membrane protein
VGERLFRFLFKYPSLVFEQADFAWGVPRPLLATLVVASILALAALLTYRRVVAIDRTRDRALLIGFRIAALAPIVFCLLRPTLILKAAVPQQNFLGILLDDSRSMAIADRDGASRSAFVQDEFGARPGASSALLHALSQRFVLRFFRFAGSADRTDSAAALTYDGTSTRLGHALDRARDELAGLPLAGLVMVTDGADTSDAAIDESLAGLKARSIPVFTVGVGRDHFARDIQITRVETPRAALKGTSLVVDAVVSQTGYGGRTVPLTVEDDGRIVSTQEVTLPDNGESATVKVRFTASEAGPRLFRIGIPVQPGEQVAQNNARDALVEVEDRREKILYFEGEPRPEMKFLLRGIADDKNLSVVVLQRTAENKYYRIGIDTPDELIAGFPKSRDELFAYRAIILGSIEAAAFTPEQMRMLADFVGKRGGGLLMLGGRRSFAEGGWAGTPLAEALPVVLETPAGRPAAYLSWVSARPTRDGAMSPVTQIADGGKSTTRWEDLPPVTAVNPIHAVKPGATVLLSGTDNRKQEQVILASQRYGRGKALAMPIQDSFLWYMNKTVAVTDKTHATYWRRLLRWLVDGVPGQVNVTTAQDRVEPGEPITLSAEVLDRAYVEVNDSHVVAHVTAPSGKTIDVPLEWIVERDGDYRGRFVPDESGRYAVRVSASRPPAGAGRPAQSEAHDGTDLQSNVVHVRVSAGDSEYFDAAMRAPLLKRVADDTGGRFFTEANAASLPDAIRYSGRGVTVVEERELWDMPALLILLVIVVGAEWTFRRTRGLA